MVPTYRVNLRMIQANLKANKAPVYTQPSFDTVSPIIFILFYHMLLLFQNTYQCEKNKKKPYSPPRIIIKLEQQANINMILCP